ncbi:hypothetical protein F4819DRAFT_230098 [Hypoxylon fuscum]|nr:hypothetical protein F4819DRAFT_230098 [Hypoxylon fuscum]
MTVSMMIGYPKGGNFNAEYYLNKHMPIVNPVWKPFGMGNWRAMAPTDTDKSPYAMLVEIEWPDMESFQRAMAETPAEKTKEIMDDLKNYTEKEPVVWFMEKAGGS